MTIRFAEQALEDTLEIHENLEQFKEGLGDRFYDHLRTLYGQMKNHTNSFQTLDQSESKRRAFLKLTKKLHYRVIYEVFPDHLEILAIKSTYKKS